MDPSQNSRKHLKMTMRRILVGGSILGDVEPCVEKNDQGQEAAETKERTFDPLVTPLIGVSASTTLHKPERFVLLPHARFIQVRAYKTGETVANLVPFSSDEHESGDNDDDVCIESVCLAKYPAKARNLLDVLDYLQDGEGDKKKRDEMDDFVDNVAIVGCSDGTLREFSLLVLLPTSRNLQKQLATSSDCGAWELLGPCYGPRRVFKISKEQKIKHVTSPSCTVHADNGLLVYALTETFRGHSSENESQRESKKRSEANASLFRLLLPPYYGDSIVQGKEIIDVTNDKGSARMKRVDKISCKAGQDKMGKVFNNLPFYLGTAVRARSQDLLNPSHESLLQQNIFIVVARPTSLLVYCERLSDISLQGTNDHRKRFMPVSFPFSSKNRLFSIAISVNNSDIACGHMKGEIVIKTNLLAQVEEYHTAMAKYEKQGASSTKDGSKYDSVGISKPDHPAKIVVDARVHWHAHPVTTLCYDSTSPASDPILYSGGKESVLITWQLSRGIDRPADVLPRLALGGILNILCPDRPEGGYDGNDGILVFCEDNTLQLFESHNKALLWKVKGLAAKAADPVQYLSSSITMDPKSIKTASSQLILNAMPDAPGSIQWYDPREQRVVGDLEVAPYNRVSRMNHNDQTPMPAPSVTHLAMSKSGNDLVTIDKVPTENEFVGTVQDADSGFGVVTTIRFWSWNASVRFKGQENSTSKPYDLVAAMIHPHGSENRVSAVALSSDGQYACTVSNDERAFRLWQRVLASDDVEGRSNSHQRSGRRMPVWVCQYKITTPSGYSNHPTGKYGVTFSPDASILAICYGSMITIWDHHEMTLLTCLNHLDDEEIVDTIEFTKHDMILCKSSTGVSLQSPFGSHGQSDFGWRWTTADMASSVKVSCAQLLSSYNFVAVSLYYVLYDVSRLVFIDMASGEPVRSEDKVMIENISGLVCSIGESEKAKQSTNWHDPDATANGGEKSHPLGLYALTNRGALLSLKEDTGSLELGSPRDPNVALVKATSGNAPRLPTALGKRNEPANKRRRVGSDKTMKRAQEKKLSMEHFGSIVDESGSAVSLPTTELPILSGELARAFVGRNLLRKGNI